VCSGAITEWHAAPQNSTLSITSTPLKVAALSSTMLITVAIATLSTIFRTRETLKSRTGNAVARSAPPAASRFFSRQSPSGINSNPNRSSAGMATNRISPR